MQWRNCSGECQCCKSTYFTARGIDRVSRTASDKPIIDGVAEAAAAAAGDAAVAEREVLVEKNTQRFARVTARHFVLEGQLSAAEEVELKACVVFIVVRAEARALRSSNAQN